MRGGYFLFDCDSSNATPLRMFMACAKIVVTLQFSILGNCTSPLWRVSIQSYSGSFRRPYDGNGHTSAIDTLLSFLGTHGVNCGGGERERPVAPPCSFRHRREPGEQFRPPG